MAFLGDGEEVAETVEAEVQGGDTEKLSCAPVNRHGRPGVRGAQQRILLSQVRENADS